jgi:hypothetical protein
MLIFVEVHARIGLQDGCFPSAMLATRDRFFPVARNDERLSWILV